MQCGFCGRGTRQGAALGSNCPSSGQEQRAPASRGPASTAAGGGAEAAFVDVPGPAGKMPCQMRRRGSNGRARKRRAYAAVDAVLPGFFSTAFVDGVCAMEGDSDSGSTKNPHLPSIGWRGTGQVASSRTSLGNLLGLSVLVVTAQTTLVRSGQVLPDQGTENMAARRSSALLLPRSLGKGSGI